MRAADQGRAAPGELASALVDDVESKKHRRDPFGDRYVAVATSEFGGGAQDGGRAAVEAAITNVHVRVELIRSMKNVLVKQTQEAVKRSTQLGPPPARQRLGTRARQAAAAAAAEAADAEDPRTSEGESSDAAFFCDDLHQALEQLLSGGGTAPAAAASLAAAQEALGAGRDGTRLPPGELALPVEGELAPPPFDALVQQLFGTDESQETAAGAVAPLLPEETAGLAAAVHALQLHTAELEVRGVLQVADAAADGWLLPDGSGGAPGSRAPAGLPAYLQAGSGQPFFLAPVRQQQQGPDSWYQHWTAPVEGAAAAESHDAIQEEADEAPDWDALEGEALLPQRRPPLQLNLQAQRQGGAAAGGVLVSFDDDQPHQQHEQRLQQQQVQAGQHTWQSGGQQWQQHSAGLQQGQGQATLSDIWESADGGTDPWMDVEEAGGHPQRQQQEQPPRPGQQVPLGALRMPTFAPRPGRQQLALSGAQQRAAIADEEIDDDDWDEGMLEQVAALERQALQERQRAERGAQQPQPQGQPHVPVFRNRPSQQALPAGAWPGESIEDADSDDEQPGAAAAMQQQAAAGMPRVGAVPQLGRRGALPLASEPAAAAHAQESDGRGGEEQHAVPAHGQQQRRGQQAPAAAGAAGGGGQPTVQADFSAIDVESLRPSVRLRQQTGGRPKWRPVFDPEQLLLQPMRSALQPPPLPPTERGPAGSIRWQPAEAQSGPAISNMAADLLAGLTAADLEEWDDWGDDEAAAGDGAGFDAGGWHEAPGQWCASSHAHQQWQQQQQQQQQPVAVGWDDAAAAAEQGPPSAPALVATAVAAAPAAEPSPAAPTVRFQSLVDVAFDYDEDDGSSPVEAEHHEQSQPAPGMSQPLQSQQQAAWASQGHSPNFGSTGAWPSQRDPHISSWQQGFAWQQASQPQHSQLGAAPARGGDVWAGLEEAADGPGSPDQQPAAQHEGTAAQHEGRCADGAASLAPAEAADPWAALAGDAEAGTAEDGWEGGSSWFTQQAAAPAERPAAAAVHVAADPPADACGGASSFGGWALDVEWEDAGPAADEQPPQPAQRHPLLPAGHAQGPSSAQGLVAEVEAAAAAAEAASMEGALEWGYDEPEQVAQPVSVGPAGSLAARLATLGVLDPAGPAAAAAAAGKRRHEQIGADIIQALLEERRRARVDLQPLLQQLSSRLAQVLAGGSSYGAAADPAGPGNGGSSVTAQAAALSAVRQACLQDGGPAVQASMQRYLVALLTAAHQHNSGAAATAAAGEAEGGAAAAPAAAVAPLAAALAGKQLLLHASGGATDIRIAVV